MHINPKALDSLTITLSPLTTDSPRVIVGAIRDKYAPNAIIEESRLAGKLAR